MEATVPCACKGVRTCLACESGDKRRRHNRHNNNRHNDNNRHNNDNNRGDDGDDSRELVLEFDPALGLAVALPGSSFAGMAARVSGVHVWCDFLSPDEERELIIAIDRDEWRPSQSGRRKQDYGPKVNFRKRRVRAAGFSGLPPLSRALALRVRAASPALLGDFVPVEQCHLEYEPSRGSSIDAHLDDAWLWGDRLVTVNLLSDTALTLTRPAADARPAGGDVETREGVTAGEAADGSVSLPPQRKREAVGGMRGTAGDGEGARREMERPGGLEERRDGPRHSGDMGTLTTGKGGGDLGGVEETGNGAGDVHSPGGAEVDIGDDDDDDDGEYVTLRPLSFWRQRRENRLRQNPTTDLQSPTATSATTPQMHRPPAPRNSGSWVRVPASSVTVRVPSPRRSLVLLHGAARRSWLHAVRRGDVAARRVCITLRELSAEFRPEPRALALLADEAMGPEGTTRMDRAEPEEAAAEVGELQSGRSAEIGVQLLATALTFRGTPVL